MNEILEFLKSNPELISLASLIVSALGAVINGLIALLFAHIKHRLKLLTCDIENAKIKGAYTVCPHCKEKLPLEDLHWKLEDGSDDDDLNGLKD